MDEWTNELDLTQLDAIRSTVHCVLEAMNQAEVGALKGCNLCKRGLEHDCSGSSHRS